MLEKDSSVGANQTAQDNIDALDEFVFDVDPLHEFLARMLLVSMHGGTFLALCFYLYVMYSKVEIDHPMLAVLFQEMAMLCSLQTLSFVSILFSGINYGKARLPTFLNLLGLQIHQWSWFTVSSIR